MSRWVNEIGAYTQRNVLRCLKTFKIILEKQIPAAAA